MKVTQSAPKNCSMIQAQLTGMNQDNFQKGSLNKYNKRVNSEIHEYTAIALILK